MSLDMTGYCIHLVGHGVNLFYPQGLQLALGHPINVYMINILMTLSVLMLALGANAQGYLADYRNGNSSSGGNYLSDYNSGSSSSARGGDYLNDYSNGGFSVPGGASRPSIPTQVTTSRAENHAHQGHRAEAQARVEAQRASRLRHNTPPCGNYHRAPSYCGRLR